MNNPFKEQRIIALKVLQIRQHMCDKCRTKSRLEFAVGKVGLTVACHNVNAFEKEGERKKERERGRKMSHTRTKQSQILIGAAKYLLVPKLSNKVTFGQTFLSKQPANVRERCLQTTK